MKNLFKEQNAELDFTSLSTILSSGATAGMAIASFAGKKGNVGGIIGAGLSLLVTGIITSIDYDASKNKYKIN
jgi:hypothetical protein